MMLAAIANDYITRFRGGADRELRFYKMQRTLADAIRQAALSRTPSGKRHPHQCRIPGRVLEAAERHLQAAAARIRRAKSFAELHDIVEAEIGSLRGIGELAVYDTAHRIGAYLGLEPEAVYLHAGTRVGARALDLAGDVVALGALPPALRRLSAAEIEDCLCIYKSALQRGGLRHSPKSSCAPARGARPC